MIALKAGVDRGRGRRIGHVHDHLGLLVLEPGRSVLRSVTVKPLTRTSHRKLGQLALHAFQLTNVGSATVKNDLVTALSAGDLLQGFDEVEAKLATLHSLGNRDVLDVSDNTKTAGELAFHENSANSDELERISQRMRGFVHLVRLLLNKGRRKVRASAGLHSIETG